MKTPPKAPRKHWYTFGVDNVQTLCYVRRHSFDEAQRLAMEVNKTCMFARFRRIPAVDAYKILRSGVPVKGFGEMRRALNECLALNACKETRKRGCKHE